MQLEGGFGGIRDRFDSILSPTQVVASVCMVLRQTSFCQFDTYHYEYIALFEFICAKAVPSSLATS